MTDQTYALAPLPQQTIANWHRFAKTADGDVLRPLLADGVVFRSPAVQSPIPGLEATVLVLTTVMTIFENVSYQRMFVAGTHEVGLEFSANIGKWQLKGIDLMRFDPSGRVVELEVMIRPLKAMSMLAETMGNRIGPQLLQMKQMGQR
jgi:hypothetical protein